jgi:competence protein ComEC
MASAARPLVLAVVALLLGLLPGLRYGPDPGLAALFAAGLVLLPLALARAGFPAGERLAGGILWSTFVLAGAALGAATVHGLADDCRSLLADRSEVRVTAVLAANALPSDRTAGSPPLLPVSAREVWRSGQRLEGCGGAIRVRLPDGDDGHLAGTVLVLHGEWTRFAAPVVPSGWPADPRYAGFLRVDSLSVLEPASLLAFPLLTLRGRSERHLHSLFPHHGPLAEALLLGRREQMDPALRERFARAGMAHLLAISGMHVGLIAGMLLLAARWLARLHPLPRRAPVWIAIGGIFAYLAIIGAPPSAVRAGIMICLALLGLLLQRPFSIYSVVAAAALAIVAHRPLTVLEPGFQLSFAGVLGIVMVRPVAFAWLPEAWTQEGWRRNLSEMTVASAAAFAATAPVVIWHFGLVAPVGLLSNLLGIPVMGLGLAGLVAAAVTTPVVAPLGRLLALGTEAAFHLLDRIAVLAAAAPYGHAFVPRPDAWVWFAAAAAALLVVEATRRQASRVRWLTAIGAALVVFGAGPAAAGVAGAGRGSLEVHFLDVGQGDAVAIRTPGDRWVLVDAGPAGERFDAGERRVLPFLRARGAARVEALILSHPHLDHIGGAPAVLRALPVGALIEPGFATGSSTYLEVLRAAESAGVPWRAARSGRVLELDGVRFEFVWPDPEMLDVAADANEISAVLLVRFGAFAALLTGDAYIAQEEVLARRHGAALRAQVLKAGHHGSYTSTSATLLDAVRPELVVISAGRRNRFGHPAPEVLDELGVRGIPVARTDRAGTVSIVVESGRSPYWYLANP